MTPTDLLAKIEAGSRPIIPMCNGPMPPCAQAYREAVLALSRGGK